MANISCANSDSILIMKLTENKKLVKVSLHDPLAPPILSNFQDWNSIPKLAIITGRNGSGKSQLLSYINSSIIKSSWAKVYDFNHFYNENQFKVDLNNTKISSFHLHSNHLLSNIRSFYFKDDKNIKDVMIDLYKKFHHNNYTTFFDIHLPEFRFNMYHYFMKIDYKCDEYFVEKLNKKLLDCFKNLKNKSVLTLQTIEHDIDRFLEDFSHGFENVTKDGDNLMAILIRSYFKYKQNIIKMNPDPLIKEIACESNVNPIDEINKRLATNCFDSDRFEFRVNEQDFKIDLYKNGNQVELLSSGEEFLIGLALLAYDFDKRALRDLVILDEPDRHLDPKSI